MAKDVIKGGQPQAVPPFCRKPRIPSCVRGSGDRDQTPQSRAADAQALGGGSLISAGLRQDALSDLLVDLVQRLVQIQRRKGAACIGGGDLAVLLLPQDLPYIFSGDDLLRGGGQGLYDALKLRVVVGPVERLQQLDGLRLGPQDRIGDGGVQETEGGLDLGGNGVLQISQGLKVEGAAVQTVQEFAPTGDSCSPGWQVQARKTWLRRQTSASAKVSNSCRRLLVESASILEK